jgi:recombination protein RecA
VVKNKVAPPFKQANFDILYNEGISLESELVELGVLHGLIEKTGAWYSYNGERLGQGKENVRLLLKDNPKMAAEIDAGIRAIALPEADVVASAEEQKEPVEAEA